MPTSALDSLPYYLRKCMSCFVEVNSSVVDWAPSIVICSSDGYLYEINANKIINCLNLNGETGNNIGCAYLGENEKTVIFYTVFTESCKLFIIKRCDFGLEVTRIFEDVESFHVYDFECFGYPQISIKGKSYGSFITTFPVNYTEAVVDKFENENLTSLSKALAEKFQIVRKHVAELTEECYNMRKLCECNTYTENVGLLPVGCIQFSAELEKYTNKAILTAKWMKVIGGKLILGMEIQNDGEEAVSDLEFLVCDKVVKEYSYRFFSKCDELISPELFELLPSETVSPSIKPGQKIIVVCAIPAELLNFSFRTKVLISCHLTSAKVKHFFLSETFAVGISDIVEHGNQFFFPLNKTYSVEDILAIKTVKLETKLKIETKYFGYKRMGDILEQKAGFTRATTKTDGFYYSISTHLYEVFIALRALLFNDSAWMIILYTSNEYQIHFLVNMFYDLLPESTRILYVED